MYSLAGVSDPGRRGNISQDSARLTEAGYSQSAQGEEAIK